MGALSGIVRQRVVDGGVDGDAMPERLIFVAIIVFVVAVYAAAVWELWHGN